MYHNKVFIVFWALILVPISYYIGFYFLDGKGIPQKLFSVQLYFILLAMNVIKDYKKGNIKIDKYDQKKLMMALLSILAVMFLVWRVFFYNNTLSFSVLFSLQAYFLFSLPLVLHPLLERSKMYKDKVAVIPNPKKE